MTLGRHSLGTTFPCDCGETHALPIEACHVGVDAARQLAQFSRARCGASCLVVSDEKTREAGGDPLLRALRDAGMTVREHCFPDAPLDATDVVGDQVVRHAAEVDFVVGLGSGTLCDLAKYAGHVLARPTVLYATAASMNGYTSAIVAMKVRGLKRTLPCVPALGVFADPEVAAEAPARMTAAGVADFLSKCSSSTDWRAAHWLRGGYYCERPREFFEGTQERLLDAAPKVPSGDVDAIATVMDALLLSGLSMVVAGSSSPASGGEHLISHYLDMKSALYGTPHDLHGAQVGVATLYCLGLWERFLEADLTNLDSEALLEAQPATATIQTWAYQDWGPDVGREVVRQWQEKALDRKALELELACLKRDHERLCAALKLDLLPRSVVERAIHASGGPVTPEALTAPPEEYYKALERARFIRNRFTVLDLAAELQLTPS